MLSRRALGKKIVFVDVGDGERSVQALLKPAGSGRIANEVWTLRSRSTRRLGARVVLRGTVRPSQSGTPLLVARTARLVAAAPSKHGVRTVVDAVRERRLSAAAAAEALGASVDEVDVLQAGGGRRRRRLCAAARACARMAAKPPMECVPCCRRRAASPPRQDRCGGEGGGGGRRGGGRRARGSGGARRRRGAQRRGGARWRRRGGGRETRGGERRGGGAAAPRRRRDRGRHYRRPAADGTPRLTCVLMHPALDDEDGSGCGHVCATARRAPSSRWRGGGSTAATTARRRRPRLRGAAAGCSARRWCASRWRARRARCPPRRARRAALERRGRRR